jgi:hypothetical protein
MDKLYGNPTTLCIGIHYYALKTDFQNFTYFIIVYATISNFILANGHFLQKATLMLYCSLQLQIGSHGTKTFFKRKA